MKTKFLAITIFLMLLVLGNANVIRAVPVYGVTTGNQLVRFDTDSASVFSIIGVISGLQANEEILSIDFRPATGQLFALGSTSRLYVLNIGNASATAVGNAFTPALTSTAASIDFNPTVDRIRLTNVADQNLRLNPNDGATVAVDGALAFAATDPNAAQNPNIVASAYTNSFAGATTTTLYNLDSNLDILTIQNPPNNGTQNTVGALGINITGLASMDILAGSNQAFAAIELANSTNSTLYSINLTTGAATPIRNIPGAKIRAIALSNGAAGAGNRTLLDFDGDRRADYAVFNATTNNWKIRNSLSGTVTTVNFGLSNTDALTPGDYDGDGKFDIGVWRNTNGVFYVFRSSDATVQSIQWGTNGDEPVARDYDGDGKTDFAVIRRSGGLMNWFILNSATNNTTATVQQFGLATDRVALGDYDGDRRSDIAVYREGAQSVFYVLRSSNGGVTGFQWGTTGDLVVPGDYDGDGRTDYAVGRNVSSKLIWYLNLSGTPNTFVGFQWGDSNFQPAQADYDGDGKTDITVWNPANDTFYTASSLTPASPIIIGFNDVNDFPVARRINVF